MGSQLALKSRISSTASLEKIFNAQEMIASSHIAKARDVALNAKPYTDAIFDAVQALVAHTHIDHPIVKKDEDNPGGAGREAHAGGCSRAQVGSWFGRPVDLLDHPRNGIAAGPPRCGRQAAGTVCVWSSRCDVLQVPQS